MVRTKKAHINYKHKCVADSIFYVYVLLQKSLDLLALQFTASVNLPYFLGHKTHRTIRRTLIFLFDFLEKNNDECILILVIYWKKTGLVHNKISTII